MTSYTRMREIEETVWVADDGTEFPEDMDACLAYESTVHVTTKVKNVYLYLDSKINGCGVYSIQRYKDFTSLAAVLGLSRTNQDISSSDVSFKSVTAQFNRFPLMVVHNPVENVFSIQTVEKFKTQYDIPKLCATIEILKNLMVPVTEGETPGTGENPPTDPGTSDGDNTGTGDGNGGGDNTGDGEETDPKDPENPGNTGNGGGTTAPETPGTGENPPTDPTTPENPGDNTGTGDGNGGGTTTPETPDGGDETEPTDPGTSDGDNTGDSGTDTGEDNTESGGGNEGGGNSGENQTPEIPDENSNEQTSTDPGTETDPDNGGSEGSDSGSDIPVQNPDDTTPTE